MKKIFFALSLFISVDLFAQEEILRFDSHITVNRDRSITVTETINVNSEGHQIQRGILRDLPTTAQGPQVKTIRYDFAVLEVLRDGIPENFDVTEIGDGKRIRIGHADVLLTPGTYTYTITYNMKNQVRFFDHYDELYWNVTGGGWDFVIREASATVVLPGSATILQHTGYSGAYGQTECRCTFEKISQNEITYAISDPLLPGEQLTIAIGWNKGVISPPTDEELREEALRELLPLIIGIGGVLLVLFYYIFAWKRVGRDPATGIIIPRFDPPAGFSPAAARFVHRMGFDKKAFTAAIVNMAVKGFLTIKNDGGDFQLIKNIKGQDRLSPGEKNISTVIFRDSDTFTVKQSNHVRLMQAIENLKSQLKLEFEKANFKKNIGWLAPGLVLSVAVVIVVILLNLDNEVLIISIVSSFFVMSFLVPILYSFHRAGANAYGVKRGFYYFIFIVILCGFFVLGYRFLTLVDPEFNQVSAVAPYFLIIASLVFFNMLFFYLIKAPTTIGRQRMDEIEGLKMFMEVAEKRRLNMMNPPEQTPQLFEKLLPFAIALNVENEWGKQFNYILERAIQDDKYHPTWYRGRKGDVFRAPLLTSSLGSEFSSAIASSSMSPQSSSSSGSGGGGSSGGGGGGGGGGGW